MPVRLEHISVRRRTAIIEVIFDFDDDSHHAFSFKPRQNADDVATCLISLAEHIRGHDRWKKAAEEFKALDDDSCPECAGSECTLMKFEDGWKVACPDCGLHDSLEPMLSPGAAVEEFKDRKKEKGHA